MNRNKSNITVLFLVLGLFSILGHAMPSNAKTAAQLPSIRACTLIEIGSLSSYLNDVNSDLNKVNAAVDKLDLDELRDTAIEMHKNWYEASPDIPYCAQGVHTRLLVDRAVESTVLMALTLHYGDYEISLDYVEMMQDAGKDLQTYGGILSSYQ